jgi:hypothetical protein
MPLWAFAIEIAGIAQVGSTGGAWGLGMLLLAQREGSV